MEWQTIVNVVAVTTGLGGLIVSLRKVRVEEGSGSLAQLSTVVKTLREEVDRITADLEHERELRIKEKREYEAATLALAVKHKQEIDAMQLQIDAHQRTITRQSSEITQLKEQITGR